MQHFKFSLMVGACILGLAITAQAEDNAAQAATRAALLKQLSQANTATLPAAPAPKPVQPAPPVVAPVVVAPIVTTTTNGDNAAQAAARAALAQHPVLATPTPPTTAPVAPVIVAQPVVASPAPVVVPVVPALTTKEGRLQALNAQYKMGQITPLDYFNQREAILKGN